MALDPFPPFVAAAAAARTATIAARGVALPGGLPDTNQSVLDLCNAVEELCDAVEALSQTLSTSANVSVGDSARALITKA